MTTRVLGVAALAAPVLFFASCAGSDDTASSPTEIEVEADAPTAPSASPTPLGTAVEEEVTVGSDDPSTEDLAAAPWPAPALPILRTFVMDQTVWYPTHLDGALYMGSALGVGRLDTDTAEFEQITTVRPDQFLNTTFLTRPAGSHVMVLTDVDSVGGGEALVFIDPETFTELGRIDGEGTYLLGFGVSDETVIGVEFGRRYDVVDPATQSAEPLPVPGGAAAVPWVLDGEIWTIETDGDLVVYDRSSGEELRRTTLPITAGFAQVGIDHVTDEHVWVTYVRDAVLVKLDRSSLEVIDEIDVAALHGVEVASSLWVGPTYHALRVFDADRGGWTVLGRYDFEAQELVHAHTAAPTDPRYGWDTFVSVTWAEAEGRLFVQDHRRRIVEVDVDRLSDLSTDAWADPGLARDPVLTPEEQAVGDIVLASINDGLRERRTRPDAITPELRAELDRAGERFNGFEAAAWRLDNVAIEGDRAWVWAYPVDENGENPTGALPTQRVLRRIDGEWFIDTDWTCTFIATFGFDCQG